MRRALAVFGLLAIEFLVSHSASAQSTTTSPSASTRPVTPPASATSSPVDASAPAVGVAGGCDRICLTGILEQYLGALARHQPTSAPFASKVKFTENTVQIPLGEGLWLGVTEAPTTFRVSAIDAVAGQIGFYGLLKAWGTPALVTIRLKVENSKITEAEHIIVRQLRPGAMPNLVTPRPGLIEDVAPRERNSREAMTHIALSYFDAIEQDKGALAPFADDCERHENGLQTTTNKVAPPLPPGSGPGSLAEMVGKIGMLGCKAGIDSGVLSYITRVEPRRVLVVDEQKGLVFAFPMFVHRGDKQYIEIKGVPGVDRLPTSGLGASNLMAGELFKIRNLKIYEIEAMGLLLPYMSRTGWED
jgi:hypothetical protein